VEEGREIECPQPVLGQAECSTDRDAQLRDVLGVIPRPMFATVDGGGEGPDGTELVLSLERGNPLVGVHVPYHRRVVDDSTVLAVFLRVIQGALGEAREVAALD